jgi:DNA polymerase I
VNCAIAVPSRILLDGHSLAYRAFYALPDTLRTQTGQLTNAVYGFTSMLIRLLADRRPDAIAVAFDKGRDVARTEAYPEYKANRAAPPDEFRPQVDLIKQVLEVLDVPVLEVAGVEADDVLATLARRAVGDGFHAYVVTGDRDAMQLADDHVTILYTLRGITEMAEMTPPAVEERYGVPPTLLRGPRGAARRQLGQPARRARGGGQDRREARHPVRRHRRRLRPPRRGLGQEGAGDAGRARGAGARQPPHHAPARRRRGGRGPRRPAPRRHRRGRGAVAVRHAGVPGLFDRFVEDVLGEQEEAGRQRLRAHPAAAGGGELAAWLEGATGPLAVAVDVATTRRTCGWRRSRWRPRPRPGGGAARGPRRRRPRPAHRVLADPTIGIVCHDAKTLDHALQGEGLRSPGVTVDTELAAYLLDPSQRTFDLERLALQHLQRTLRPRRTRRRRAAGAGGRRGRRLGGPGLRAEAVLHLAEHLGTLLDERGSGPARDDRAAAGAGAGPHGAGRCRAGPARARRDPRPAGRTGRRARARDPRPRRPAVQLRLGPQLQEVLFEELGLPKTRRIKTGYSTDAQALQNLLGQHPIIEAILEWREVSKLLTTYVDALPPLVDPTTGRIHTTLSQTIAATGRLSSSHPNLQNIPIRRQEGREIRRAFVPGEGYDQLLVADYSQIELRIMAHLSQDEGLLEAFASAEDVHATTAAKVFDLPLDAVDGALRDRAKAVNYGLAYGLTAYGLSQQLGIPPDEAQEIVDAYLERFPKVSSSSRRPSTRPGAAATPPRCSGAAATCPTWCPTTATAGRWPSGWR